MSLREWMLFALLAVAGACVVKGVSVLSTSGSWVAAGVVVAGLAFLVLAGAEDAPKGDGE